MRRTLRWLCLCGLIGLAGFALSARVQAQGRPPPALAGDYRLGPGDTIGVLVFQNPDLSLDAHVSESGVISYPLIGTVGVGGLTLVEAQSSIALALRSGGYVRDPQVSIVLRQMRGHQVSVLGQVSRPGRFVLESFNTRVSDMLAAAGGISAAGDDWLVVTGSAGWTSPFVKVIDVPALFAASALGR
jgi:polysaccharide biosynthesis/export protein